MSDEQRQYDIFGQKFLIETNTDRFSKPGKAAYFMQSQTEDKILYNQSLHEGSGLARIHAGKTLQLDAGDSHDSDDVNTLVMVAKKGNASINADGGSLLLKAREIVLEAKDGLYLQGANVQVGFPQMGRTDHIEITGGSVNVTTRGGNIGELLRTSNIFQAFEGSYVIGNLVSGVTKGVGKFFG
jgi:hypothetical protein